MKKIWIWNHYATEMYKVKGGRHYWFAENLQKIGYDVTIFCANTYHYTEEYIDTGRKKYVTNMINNIPFVFVKTKLSTENGLDRIMNMVVFFYNIFAVAKEYIKENGTPDFILASSVHPLTMVAGIKVAKRLNIPCICEIRDLWPEAIFKFNKLKEESLLGKLLIKGEHWIYKNADALIFTKEGDTDYIKERKWDVAQGGEVNLDKAYYINNGLDIEEFNRAISENMLDDKDLETEKFNITYIGTIRPVNNVGNILDAAKHLKDDPNFQFLIYGDGNQREMLEKRIVEEDITNVKIKGFIEKKYIPYILSKSSVNILNYSNTQYNWSRGNSSNKLFEYMASGKPIISTVSMGYSIIEKYKCGLELETGSHDELAEAIIKVKELSPSKYEELSRNAKNGAEYFDFKVHTQKLLEIIESL
ncbi:glycosyltransferase family 4 protein [Ruoffia sp. FAM 26254]|uniref:glycosyltransferase family 4 protein n=1 Tax=Ruoffia sp. FAM 26254 TaxID=3259518 RepID=UPI00388A1F2E